MPELTYTYKYTDPEDGISYFDGNDGNLYKMTDCSYSVWTYKSVPNTTYWDRYLTLPMPQAGDSITVTRNGVTSTFTGTYSSDGESILYAPTTFVARATQGDIWGNNAWMIGAWTDGTSYAPPAGTLLYELALTYDKAGHPTYFWGFYPYAFSHYGSFHNYYIADVDGTPYIYRTDVDAYTYSTREEVYRQNSVDLTCSTLWDQSAHYPAGWFAVYPKFDGITDDLYTIETLCNVFDYLSGGTFVKVSGISVVTQAVVWQWTDGTEEYTEHEETYDTDMDLWTVRKLSIVGSTVVITDDDHHTIQYTYQSKQIESITITDKDDVIYVMATVKSDPDEISCVLYNCTCDPRYVEKTQYLDSVSIIHGSWVSPYNQFSPTLRLDLSEITNDDGDTVSVSDFNYVKIIDQTGGRFYYVTDRSCVGKGVWDIYLTEDVLMTFPEVIGSMTAMVDRWEGSTDGTIVDPIFPVGAGQTLTTKEVTMVNDIFSPTNCSWVLNGYNLATGGDVNE